MAYGNVNVSVLTCQKRKLSEVNAGVDKVADGLTPPVWFICDKMSWRRQYT